MSNRKYPSGYEKIQKKRKLESFVNSQKGAIEKFILCNKKGQANSSKESNEKINEDVLGDSNDPIEENIQEIHNTLDDNENQETNNKDLSRIYDPGRWKNLDDKSKNLVIEKGPIREIEIDFPKEFNFPREKSGVQGFNF